MAKLGRGREALASAPARLEDEALGIHVRRDMICVLGDLHGHLQLGLCMAAEWQRELGVRFEAVILAGDVGTFTHPEQLDSTTRRHAKANPCELEFMTQWSAAPPAPWLERIFSLEGLELRCPVLVVHGNHEGFAALERLRPDEDPPEAPIPVDDLPAFAEEGPLRFLSYLPSGWRVRLRSGAIVAGIGGIERGQRAADYHPMAYLDEDAVAWLSLLREQRGRIADVLVTHQGPARLQGDRVGSVMLDELLGAVRVWAHAHSTPTLEVTALEGTQVVPLGDVAFQEDEPGEWGWCAVELGAAPRVITARPSCWRAYRRRRWRQTEAGLLVAPSLEVKR